MNTNFTAWTNDKDDNSTDPTEEQIDPTFARHQDPDFPTVEDVTAAAVANAQQQNQQAQHRQSHQPAQTHNLHQVHHQQHQQHDDHVRAAQAAAELQQAQQHQHHQIVAAAAAGVANLPSEDKKSSSASRPHRAVSTTKRAAQNRSAQRAFRQRKEKYIKDLEQQAAEVNQLKQTIEELRTENLQLRDYTLALQSRLIELSPPNTHHQLTSNPSNQPNPSSHDNVPAPPAAVFNNNKMFNTDK